MRTNPEVQRLMYKWVSLKEAGESLGVTPEHVLALGEAGELEISDMRLPGSKRGVYRVNPDSVETFRSKRRVGSKVA